MYRPYLRLLATVVFSTTTVWLNAQTKPADHPSWENGFINSLSKSHDMALPPWGPYSNKYNGISHIPKENNGFRFDVIVQPSIYLRNLTPLANVKRESGYHPWQAEPDLSYFSYRYELEWKDRAFCDVSFSKVDEHSRLIKAEFVNQTNGNRSLALNIFSSAIFPYSKSIKPVLPDQVKWHEAAGYISLTDSVKPSNYNLVYDGQLRNQVNDENAVSHTAIVIGKRQGQELYYQFDNDKDIANAVILLRYKVLPGNQVQLQATINHKSLKTLPLSVSGEYSLATINAGDLPKGQVRLSFKVLGKNTEVKLDGFAVLRENDASVVKFKNNPLNFVPKQSPVGIPNALILKFDDIREYYGLVWNDMLADKRELFDDNPDLALSVFNNLVKSGTGGSGTTRIQGNGRGWFNNVFSAPIIVRPGQRAIRYAYVVCGNDEKALAEKLRQLDKNWENAENIYRAQQAKAGYRQVNKSGEPYRLSQQLMEATTLTNLLYPTFMGNQYLKHTTPGKRWSSLYTWDSGFIGLGYSALSINRALESLNAYTMDDTEQSAFLEHGTPLPVQAYLFNELWNKTQDMEFLRVYYPRLRRYYNFLGGAEHSPTRKLRSNLIKTWDIFYNSGGWDDYSPQVFVHDKKLEQTVAPAVNTSHQIRFAKLLRMAAWQLGYRDDARKYESDILMYGKALQEHAWDEASGYYGYVTHDGNGNPTGILQDPSGGNFNMGLDGCSPLLAGICTPSQRQKIIDHLFTNGRLWTDHGITAIDQTAPYYNRDGYWNGRVWMPHQWFFWKTMLDLNEPQRALQIAQTALNVWKRETEDTYNCWENFSIESGNGGGWHQFGALSSPVLNWYDSLFKPGVVTTGFNIWPITKHFTANKDGFKGKFKLFADGGNRSASLLVCLSDSNDYEAKCNGKDLQVVKAFEGLYIVKINLSPSDNDIFNLELTKKDK